MFISNFASLTFLLANICITLAMPMVCTAKTMYAPTANEAGLSWNEVVGYAKANLPQTGVLKMKDDGFVYLQVDDNYIHTLFPMLDLRAEGYREPPYFRREDSPGAHISVIYSDEHVVPQELGQTIHFKLNHVAIVKPSKKVSYAILEVSSPELEKLREKYGLTPKLHGHEFHISLAKKTHPKRN